MIALLAIALLSFGQPAGAPQPIDVTLLVDVSDSMTVGPYQRDVALVTEAAGDLALRLVDGDAARIGTFGSRIAIQPPVADPNALRLAATQLTRQLGGFSPIWDAVAEAVKTFPNTSRTRGIILITDGRATGNRTGFADLLTILRNASVPVFVVFYDPYPWIDRQPKPPRPNPNPAERLEQLAQVTGGTYVSVAQRRAPIAGAVVAAVDALRERSR